MRMRRREEWNGVYKEISRPLTEGEGEKCARAQVVVDENKQLGGDGGLNNLCHPLCSWAQKGAIL